MCSAKGAVTAEARSGPKLRLAMTGEAVKTSPLGCSPIWNEDDLQGAKSAEFPVDAATN
jgi:hypothetical protein